MLETELKLQIERVRLEEENENEARRAKAEKEQHEIIQKHSCVKMRKQNMRSSCMMRKGKMKFMCSHHQVWIQRVRLLSLKREGQI